MSVDAHQRLGKRHVGLSNQENRGCALRSARMMQPLTNMIQTALGLLPLAFGGLLWVLGIIWTWWRGFARCQIADTAG
jgi:hypothetical protein